LTMDPSNCGACNNQCASAEVCAGGACQDACGGCPIGWVCFVGSCCNPTVSCCFDPCPP
jgi:hypothetical protein